jgi:hypothetical protein
VFLGTINIDNKTSLIVFLGTINIDNKTSLIVFAKPTQYNSSNKAFCIRIQ